MRFHAASSAAWASAGGLFLHGVVQRLDPQHRAHPRDERRLVDGLGQVLVGAGFEPGHDVRGSAFAVTRMIGMNGSVGSALSRRQTSNPSQLRHHHVEQDQVGQVLRAPPASASSPSAAVTIS